MPIGTPSPYRRPHTAGKNDHTRQITHAEAEDARSRGDREEIAGDHARRCSSVPRMRLLMVWYRSCPGAVSYGSPCTRARDARTLVVSRARDDEKTAARCRAAHTIPEVGG